MPEIFDLLVDYHAGVLSRMELLQQLVSGSVIVLASYDASSSSIIALQTFIRDGKSFIPFFSDITAANRLLAGASLDPSFQYCEARVDFLANTFHGPEWLVINAGEKFMVELYAYELKSMLSGAGHCIVLTAPTSAKIGKPASPPSEVTLLEMQAAVSSTSAHIVYWFWMSLSDDNGHLGLAVAPGNEVTMNQVGSVIEPIWKRCRPDNSLITVAPLETDSFLEAVRVQGEILYRKNIP